MMDKSRITLCMALLALFAFNPLSGFFKEPSIPNDYSTKETGSGRTILSTEDSFMDSFWLFSPAGWMMNLGLHIILFLIVMVKIFVYGEVRVDVKSKAMQRFWIHRRQADLEMKSGGNVEEIKKHLHFAAASLGRPVPVKSRLELFASAVWQLTHQLLYRLGVTRWFINRAGGFALDLDDRKHIRMVRQECAKVYHQLHEVHLCEESTACEKKDTSQKPDHLLGLVLALTAVNLAESSRESMNDSLSETHTANFLCHVYAMFALRMRHSLWRYSLLSRFFMYKARCSQVKSAPIDPNLGWVLSNIGKEFVFKNSWKFGQSTSELSYVSLNCLGYYLFSTIIQHF